MMKPRKTRVGKPVVFCCVIASILLFTGLCKALSQKNSLPQKESRFTVQQKTKMEFLLGNDTTYLTLAKGESVRFLGYRRASYYFPHKFLVETDDGQRGYINISDLDVPFVHEKDGDTLHIKKIDSKKRRYIYTKPDGKEGELGFEKVYPVLSDTLPYLIVSKDGEYYMSIEKFERLYIGKSIEEVDAHYIPASQIYHDKKGTRAYFYNYMIFNEKTGHFNHPLVTYNDSLIATSYELIGNRGNSGGLMKILPLVTKILDIPFFSGLIRGSFYVPRIPGMSLAKADQRIWQMWVVGIFTLLLNLIWWFLAAAFPAVLIGFLIRFNYLFYHLSDGVLIIIISILALVSFYIWCVLMLSYGMLWFLLPIIFFASLWAYRLACTPLDTIPHDRCLGCRRMYSNYLDHSDLIKEYDQWEERSFLEDSYKSGERRWQTYTETRYSDGHTETSNRRDHKEITTTHVYGTYNCLVHYWHYEHHYYCDYCGYDEVVPETKEQILEKHKIGTHSTTSTHQVY